jgi:DNA-directed RNA polymerase specialized sigma24 family protein
MFLSQQEYEAMARKTVLKYGCGLQHDILTDVDLFGSVVNAMYVADWKWSPNHKPKSSRRTLRILYARYKIMDIVRMYKSYNNNRVSIFNNQNKVSSAIEEQCVHDGDIKKIDSKEVADKIKDDLIAQLDKIDTKVLELRIKGLTLREIGSILKLSGQRVHQRLTRIKGIAHAMVEKAPVVEV